VNGAGVGLIGLSAIFSADAFTTSISFLASILLCIGENVDLSFKDSKLSLIDLKESSDFSSIIILLFLIGA